MVNFRKTVESAIADLNYRNLNVSLDVYGPEQNFVVVHGLQSKSRSQGFQELLRNNKDYKIMREAFVISAENYRIIQIKKNLDSYLEREKEVE